MKHHIHSPTSRDPIVALSRSTGSNLEVTKRVRSIIWLPLVLLSAPANADLRPTTAEDKQTVANIVSRMTIEEKLGQMFMVGFAEERVRNDTRLTTLLTDYKIGNIVLFERNISGMRPWRKDYKPADVPLQVANLTNSLQRAVAPLDQEPLIYIPLSIAIDQEGGSAQTIDQGMTSFPGALSIGQSRSTNLADEVGQTIGKELRAMGITMNLAPVMDIDADTGADIINDRSFGAMKDIVTPLGNAFMKGLHKGGVIAVAKHFPGHGVSKDNPHTALPVVERERTFLQNENIPPFQALIDKGLNALMPAHIQFQNLKTLSGLPISLDPILRTTLRDDLQFQGVIIGDDLTGMRAAVPTRKHRGNIRDAIIRSVNSGTDIVMLAHPEDLGNLRNLTDVLDELAHKYRRDFARIDESVRRILEMKLRIGKLDARSWTVNPGDVRNTVNIDSHRGVAEKVAAASIVVISEGGQLVSGDDRLQNPLTKVAAREKILVVSPVFTPPDTLHDEIANEGIHNVDSIRLLYGWQEVESNRAIIMEAFNGAEDILESDDIILQKLAGKMEHVKAIVFGIVTRDHVGILENFLETAVSATKPVIVLVFRQPNLLTKKVFKHPNVSVISVGSGVNPSIRAAVRALYGNITPKKSEYATVSILKDEWAPIKASAARVNDNGGNDDIDPPGPAAFPPIYAYMVYAYMFLICLLASLVGAFVSLVISGDPLLNLKWADFRNGLRSGNLVMSLVARAAFGLVLFVIGQLVSHQVDSRSGLPEWMEMIAGIVQDWPSLTAAILGFVGGACGSHLMHKRSSR